MWTFWKTLLLNIPTSSSDDVEISILFFDEVFDSRRPINFFFFFILIIWYRSFCACEWDRLVENSMNRFEFCDCIPYFAHRSNRVVQTSSKNQLFFYSMPSSPFANDFIRVNTSKNSFWTDSMKLHHFFRFAECIEPFQMHLIFWYWFQFRVQLSGFSIIISDFFLFSSVHNGAFIFQNSILKMYSL